mmetsp:Transcript_75382/g.125213  ORF Transcript_75382/g.125213 Transcript_75382/m.125213 type:complete len:99 (-) Transcript_75382:576-872(-)
MRLVPGEPCSVWHLPMPCVWEMHHPPIEKMAHRAECLVRHVIQSIPWHPQTGRPADSGKQICSACLMIASAMYAWSGMGVWKHPVLNGSAITIVTLRL